MKIERFKSILLVLLVISSIVLTVNKWFNEKLWPEGYNFFSDVKNYFVSGDSAKTSSFDPVEEVLKPAKIILNNSGNHVLYTKSSAEYDSLFSEIKTVLTLTALANNSAISSDDEWNNNLKGKSCYFSYPVEYNSDYFFSQLSVNHTAPSVESVREFIVSIDERISSSAYIYVRDSYTDKIVKYRISHESEVISSLIDQSAHNTDDINYYSFELNFDSESDDSVKQHIVIDPDVLINISQKKIAAIGEQNLFTDIAQRQDIYLPILDQFGYNTTTIRRYIEPDNSAVFVENYGTLKFHTDGILDYKSVDNTNGVALSGDTAYECINSCISFVNSISASIGFSQDMYWEISSNVTDISSKSFKLCFDYYINDNMIISPDNSYGMTHAVEVEVAGGKIISYKQLCRSFNTGDYYITCSSAIDAIDSLNEAQSASSATISDIFTAYTYNSEKRAWSPLWHIENSAGEISVISAKTEVMGQ